MARTPWSNAQVSEFCGELIDSGHTPTPTGRILDHMSVYDWIEQYVPGGHRSRFGRLLDAAYNEEYGAETADQVILCMSFAVLRTLDYSGAGFDQRKQTAITQLGAGRNAKLQLQFGNRLWNAQGSNGNVYTTSGSRTPGTSPAPRRARPGSSSTTRAAMSPPASLPRSPIRRTSRGTWKAARARASEPPTRSSG